MLESINEKNQPAFVCASKLLMVMQHPFCSDIITVTTSNFNNNSKIVCITIYSLNFVKRWLIRKPKQEN